MTDGRIHEVPQPWASGADWPCSNGVSCTTELLMFETAAECPVCWDTLYIVLSNPRIEPQLGLQEQSQNESSSPSAFSIAFILCSLSLNNKLDSVTLLWWVASSFFPWQGPCKGWYWSLLSGAIWPQHPQGSLATPSPASFTSAH